MSYRFLEEIANAKKWRAKNGWKIDLDIILVNALLEDNEPVQPFEEVLCYINCKNEEECVNAILRYRYDNEVYYEMMSDYYKAKSRERYFAKKLKEGITNRGEEDYEISDNHND